MKNIIAQIGKEFIKNLTKAFENGNKSLAELEDTALIESKKCSAKLISAYFERVDAEILSDRQGRREMGCTVQRRNDERCIQTTVGEVKYCRTYYKNASGGYEYLTDKLLKIDSRERISDGLSLGLARAAKEMSYAKSSLYVSNGEISRQTVMNKVRNIYSEKADIPEKRHASNLHIDADEAHVTINHGKKRIVPLISVYEGIEHIGKRNVCKNVFHISEYGKTPDELWEQTLYEIERRYDLSDTKIYLHGDGGAWIQTGLEWIPNTVFVLDKYHKNKAIKEMTAGLSKTDSKIFDGEIRNALETEDIRFFDELTSSLCTQMSERAEKIIYSAKYLQRFVKGISVCRNEAESNNGGCTEPHISNILAARLSSRPMAWSERTLKQLAPVLAGGKIDFKCKKATAEMPKLLLKAAASASKALSSNCMGLPSADAIGRLPVNGKICGIQKILKFYE